MTNHEAIQFLDNMKHEEAGRAIGKDGFYAELMGYHVQALDIATQALKQEPCEDAVSRQAAIDLADELKDNLPDDDRLSDMVMSHNEGVLEYQTKLSLLPPVTPVEKVGRWEYIQYDGNPNIGNWHCSECNRIVCGAITAVNPVYSYKYCPECGAKMQEVKDDTN